MYLTSYFKELDQIISFVLRPIVPFFAVCSRFQTKCIYWMWCSTTRTEALLMCPLLQTWKPNWLWHTICDHTAHAPCMTPCRNSSQRTKRSACEAGGGLQRQLGRCHSPDVAHTAVPLLPAAAWLWGWSWATEVPQQFWQKKSWRPEGIVGNVAKWGYATCTHIPIMNNSAEFTFSMVR